MKRIICFLVCTMVMLQLNVTSYAAEATIAFESGEILSYTEDTEEVNIPQTINGEIVTRIGICSFGTDIIMAFWDNQAYEAIVRGYKKITIPEGIESIGMAAFGFCSGITELHIPKSMKTIENSAFMGCTSISNVYYAGSEEEWKQIFIEEGNEYLSNATLHFNAIEKNDITINLNGNILEFDQPPVIKNNRTLVPLRAIFEGLGMNVYWDNETMTASATISEKIDMSITIGENHFYYGDDIIEIDVPAQIINNRTMIPVRAISECLGAKVDWDQKDMTVYITTDGER